VTQIWDVFLLLHLEGGLPSSVLLFVVEVVTETGIGKEFGSELEGFDSFDVRLSLLSI